MRLSKRMNRRSFVQDSSFFSARAWPWQTTAPVLPLQLGLDASKHLPNHFTVATLLMARDYFIAFILMLITR